MAAQTTPSGFNQPEVLDWPIYSSLLESGWYPGRRIRMLAKLVCRQTGRRLGFSWIDHTSIWPGELVPTYREIYDWLHRDPGEEAERARQALSHMPIKTQRSYAPGTDSPANDEVGTPLQDLADQIVFDIRDAAEAVANPDLPYRGVRPPIIAPISDAHVDLVCFAMQRELRRELRDNGLRNGPLPALPLPEWPRPIKRALAERRRYRFQQWGITPESWATGTFSFFDVPEDPEWLPQALITSSSSVMTKPLEDRYWPPAPTKPPQDQAWFSNMAE